MKTNVIETGKWERELEVEVPAERIETEVLRACKDYQKELEIPGFRKGKVPIKLITARYGDSIRSSVIRELLPDLLVEVARESGLILAAPPKITKVEDEPGQALTFKATVDVWPEVEVENYKGLRVSRMAHEVTGEEIEGQLRKLQEQHATERAVDRPLARGDVLIADLQRLDEGGLVILGEKYEERYFLIGREDAPNPEFEEGLIGIKAGEERQVPFTYRQDYPDEKLAGKRDFFRVKAREVRERKVSALDDEFAKDLGEKFQTLEDLRQHLGTQLRQYWDSLSRQKLRRDLIDQLIRKNPFELPEQVVDNFLETLQREREREQRSGRARERAPDRPRDHQYTEQERMAATRRLRSYLLIEGMRKLLSIQISDDELEKFLQKRAEEIGVKPEELKDSQHLNDLWRELEEDKIMDALYQWTEIEEERV